MLKFVVLISKNGGIIMQYYTTVGQEAIDHVREKLKDNKRVLEVMDFW